MIDNLSLADPGVAEAIHDFWYDAIQHPVHQNKSLRQMYLPGDDLRFNLLMGSVSVQVVGADDDSVTIGQGNVFRRFVLRDILAPQELEILLDD